MPPRLVPPPVRWASLILLAFLAAASLDVRAAEIASGLTFRTLAQARTHCEGVWGVGWCANITSTLCPLQPFNAIYGTANGNPDLTIYCHRKGGFCPTGTTEDLDTGECLAPEPDPCDGVPQGVEQPDGSCYDCTQRQGFLMPHVSQGGGANIAEAKANALSMCDFAISDEFGCSAECVDSANSECWVSGGSVAAPVVSCALDLYGGGELGNDEPLDRQPEGEKPGPTETAEDANGCAVDLSTRTVFDESAGIGTVTRCDITTTVAEVWDGSACVPSSPVERKDCNTKYPDGSSTDESTTIEDPDGAATVTESSTKNNPAEVPETPEEGTEISAQAGNGCDQPPSCEGDPVACAQLEQEFILACEFEESLGGWSPDGPGLDDVPTMGFDMDAEFQNLLANTGWLSTSRDCPAPLSATVMGSVIEFDFVWLCDALAKISALIVAIGAFVSVRVSMGGV